MVPTETQHNRGSRLSGCRLLPRAPSTTGTVSERTLPDEDGQGEGRTVSRSELDRTVRAEGGRSAAGGWERAGADFRRPFLRAAGLDLGRGPPDLHKL